MYTHARSDRELWQVPGVLVKPPASRFDGVSHGGQVAIDGSPTLFPGVVCRSGAVIRLEVRRVSWQVVPRLARLIVGIVGKLLRA